MPHLRFNPGGHLAGRPLAFIVWWGLEPEVQRLTLDHVEQQRWVGTAFSTVTGTVGTLGVVPRDGRADPISRALNDLSDLAPLPGERRITEQQQGLPTSAFVVR